MRTVLWSSKNGDINATLAFTNNLSAVTNPGVSNDSTQKYEPGSIWVNTALQTAYICVSAAAGAAVWDIVGSGATQGQVTAPAASTATGAGGNAALTGGAGGATSGAGGTSQVTGGAAAGGNSAGGEADLTGGAGHGTSAGGAAKVVGGVGGATGAGGEVDLTGGAGGATSGAGGAAKVAGGAAAAGNSAGGIASVTAGASTGTSPGAVASLLGGIGGTGTGGSGGQATVTGGAAGAASNGNGGDVVLTGGAKDGTGVAGNLVERSMRIAQQGTPGSQDTAATLTAAQLLSGIITSNPAGAVNLQLPLATALDTAIPNSIANDSFDFSVISLSGTNLPTVTTNTGWTLVGAMTFTSVAGNAGRFRARKTATGAWTLYRLS